MSEELNADFKIVYDGTWFHDGAPIRREALAKLFSERALKVDENGQYWLQTPFEKYPVEVEDVPYVIVDYTKMGADYDFITNMGERVELGPDHPMELKSCQKTGQTLPYVEVRDGLYARLSRPVYYNLVEECGTKMHSRAQEFALGALTDESDTTG